VPSSGSLNYNYVKTGVLRDFAGVRDKREINETY